jgi:hypothetical protein
MEDAPHDSAGKQTWRPWSSQDLIVVVNAVFILISQWIHPRC